MNLIKSKHRTFIPLSSKMWYDRQPSPASSTSTVDQQEIILDDDRPQLKRPKLYISQPQVTPWKALQHHFLKHTDVKSKREKRITMAELNNEVLRRRNGWKVHHLVGQLMDLRQNEEEIRGKIDSLLKLFISEGAKRIHDLANNSHKLPEHYETLLKSQRSYGVNEFNAEFIISKIDDLLRGDLQKSNIFDEQLKDCRELVVRITNEHRDRVGIITTKFNKRIQLRRS